MSTTMFHIKFDTDSDAFAGDPTVEVARILRAVSDRVKAGFTEGVIHDTNGNRVGEYALTARR
jgi:hypothetical protein